MTRSQLQKIRPLLEEIVENKLRELLGDPDSGLKVRASVINRLRKSVQTKSGTISAEKVAKKLGLRWK